MYERDKAGEKMNLFTVSSTIELQGVEKINAQLDEIIKKAERLAHLITVINILPSNSRGTPMGNNTDESSIEHHMKIAMFDITDWEATKEIALGVDADGYLILPDRKASINYILQWLGRSEANVVN